MKKNLAIGSWLPTAGAALLAVSSWDALAAQKEISETTGFLDWASIDPNATTFMQDLGLTVGGWLNVGVTNNFNNSPGNFNGPVTFGDRTGELQLNQLYMYLQRAVASEGDDWDVGGRFDFLFGTDAIFTQAYGAPKGHWDLNLWNQRFLGTAMPQASGSLRAVRQRHHRQNRPLLHHYRLRSRDRPG